MYAQYDNIGSIIVRYETQAKAIEVISTQKKNILAEWEEIT